MALAGRLWVFLASGGRSRRLWQPLWTWVTQTGACGGSRLLAWGIAPVHRHGPCMVAECHVPSTRARAHTRHTEAVAGSGAIGDEGRSHDGGSDSPGGLGGAWCGDGGSGAGEARRAGQQCWYQHSQTNHRLLDGHFSPPPSHSPTFASHPSSAFPH